MTKVVILFITGQKCVDVLDGMIQMIERVDLGIIPFVECLAVLIGAVLGNLCGVKQRADRQKMKPVWRTGLLTALFVFDNRGVRFDAGNITP